MEQSEVLDIFNFTLPLVTEAGKVFEEAKDIKVEIKNGVFHDPVTVYDRKVEDILLTTIRAKYPSHRIIAEEESALKKEIPPLTDEPTWIIDPIDGTINFIRRFPITGISVGFLVKKECVFGIVYNPYTNELFSAIKGRGAYLNGIKIGVNRMDDITRSVINSEISIIRANKIRMNRLKNLLQCTQGYRSLGCAALGLAYVAQGTMDVYYADGLKPWDIAAGVVIVKEAGGTVTSPEGGELELMTGNILAASTRSLAQQISQAINSADEQLASTHNQ